jgi:hypothetical protein
VSPEERRRYREDQARLRKEHKLSLEKDQGLVGHPRADLLYEIAWSLGHSSGYAEVATYYHELAPLVKP